jgi:hypothetical protein
MPLVNVAFQMTLLPPFQAPLANGCGTLAGLKQQGLLSMECCLTMSLWIT